LELVRTDVSEELSASIIRLKRMSDVGTTLAVTDPFLPDDGGDTFLRNIGSYKINKA
jgi:hypothetical protein